MNARTYVLDKARVLELSGFADMVVTVTAHRQGPADISVGIYQPRKSGAPYGMAMAWCMGQGCSLDDSPNAGDANAMLWIGGTGFCVAVDHAPALLNFLGPLVHDVRHPSNTRRALSSV